jgi:hypothetical protein
LAATPGRGEVVALLATYGDRRPEQVPETVDSLELAWFVHQLQERYGRPFDVDDEVLARMTTVTEVVRVLEELGYEVEGVELAEVDHADG